MTTRLSPNSFAQDRRQNIRLIVFAGLPGTGKSTIARSLALELGAVWLRIDSIERGVREAGVWRGSFDDAGYRAAYAVAEDNLRLGLNVLADAVNPWMLTRNAWRDVGLRVAVPVIEVEIICSDIEEHRRRVETRLDDTPNFSLPSWKEIIDRDYHQWDRAHIVIDTVGRSVPECLKHIRSFL